mmetsp:Transcript_57383/g.186406  ORF Transcript_57383/g.186406 Transcript_57383/m.186406 type:complete len:255 (-) Transcript_57383:423-1187(-)
MRLVFAIASHLFKSFGAAPELQWPDEPASQDWGPLSSRAVAAEPTTTGACRGSERQAPALPREAASPPPLPPTVGAVRRRRAAVPLGGGCCRRRPHERPLLELAGQRDVVEADGCPAAPESLSGLACGRRPSIGREDVGCGRRSGSQQGFIVGRRGRHPPRHCHRQRRLRGRARLGGCGGGRRPGCAGRARRGLVEPRVLGLAGPGASRGRRRQRRWADRQAHRAGVPILLPLCSRTGRVSRWGRAEELVGLCA